MKLENIQINNLLYHLTSIDNLESIIKNGILSRQSIVGRNDIEFCDVADEGIIKKRCELGIINYIPFHFHPYTAFDTLIKNEDKNLIYLCITKSEAQSLDAKIINMHPLATGFNNCMYNYDEGIDSIDWYSMQLTGNYSEEVKMIKMAECLIEEKLDFNKIQSIKVSNMEMKIEVCNILKQYNVSVYVDVVSNIF